MAIYLRKSIQVGPLRFNLSKSGVGVSAGIKGFPVKAWYEHYHGQGTWIEPTRRTNHE